MKVMSADSVIVVKPRFRKASTPLAQPAKNKRDFGSSNTRVSKCAHAKMPHDTMQGECFFVITATASFARKQHLHKKQSTCTNFFQFETQILERPHPQSPREAQSIMKVMSADCVIMVTYPSCPRLRENSKNTMPRFPKASTPLAQPAKNKRDFGSSNTRVSKCVHAQNDSRHHSR